MEKTFYYTLSILFFIIIITCVPTKKSIWDKSSQLDTQKELKRLKKERLEAEKEFIELKQILEKQDSLTSKK